MNGSQEWGHVAFDTSCLTLQLSEAVKEVD